MQLKKGLFILFSAMIISFFIGMFYGKNLMYKPKPSYYIANTIGAQIIEQNKLYNRLGEYARDIEKEQYTFNRAMLVFIDCSWWMKDIKYDKKGLDIFIEGLETAFKIVGDADMLLCDGDINRFISK